MSKQEKKLHFKQNTASTLLLTSTATAADCLSCLDTNTRTHAHSRSPDQEDRIQELASRGSNLSLALSREKQAGIATATAAPAREP